MPFYDYEHDSPFTLRTGATLYPLHRRGIQGNKFARGGQVAVFDRLVDPDEYEFGPHAVHCVGALDWQDDVIAYVEVNEQWRKMGVATAMWEIARSRNPLLQHAPRARRTEEGNQWARSVSPELAILERDE